MPQTPVFSRWVSSMDASTIAYSLLPRLTPGDLRLRLDLWRSSFPLFLSLSPSLFLEQCTSLAFGFFGQRPNRQWFISVSLTFCPALTLPLILSPSLPLPRVNSIFVSHSVFGARPSNIVSW